MSTQALIIGGGYLGRRLLQHLHGLGQRVRCTTRSAAGARRPEALNADPVLLDINHPATWVNADPNAAIPLHVYCLVPGGQVDPLVFARFVEHIQDWPLQRAVLASSTVVFGQRERVVTADSEVDIDSPRAERQYRIEQCWTVLGAAARIVRLAGLYGPDRVIGKRQLGTGATISGPAGAWLNLVQVEDAARLLHRCAVAATAATIELGCDGHPVQRRVYYRDLAQHYGFAAPVFAAAGNGTPRGRRCDNSPTVQRTGWRPRYRDYRAGLGLPAAAVYATPDK